MEESPAMTFAFHVYETERLAVGRCDGIVLEAEIHAAIDFSFAAPRMPAGTDRIVCVEPTADLRNLDPDALHRIQVHVAQTSGGSEGEVPTFRSVLVTPSPFHRPIAELYKAIWDSYQLPGVEFSVVTTPLDAARQLGLPEPFATLMPPPPILAGRSD